MLTHLKIYNPKDNKYIEAKNNLVNNASNFYKGREKIIEGFKNKIFPIYYDEREKFRKEDKEDEEDEEDEEKNKKKNKKNKKNKKKNKKNKKKQEKQKKQDKPLDSDEVIEKIINKEGLPINNELFKKHFNLKKPILMYKVLYETNNGKEKNSKFVEIFNSGLNDLEEEIKNMSKTKT